ncbi:MULTISPECIES: DUF3574 domain-containing protein [unclassified Streptomyces]|uniref:DUF3574 domain-containing protein n=1 Tax=unclassified Streptomyces TaxID=2593676 RepID=UPI0021B14F0D|nr:DUF3574 domain-containing protein [Streptomyces sp. BHT-5-2]
MSLKIASRARIVVVALVATFLGASGSVAYAALDDQSASPSQAPASVAAVGKPYIKTELLFGTAKPNGGAPVTDKEFRSFVDTFVTPRFPAGLTVENAYGQYRDSHGKIERERSYKVTLLYPTAEARRNNGKIQQIRAAYDKRFQQESVARIDDSERVDF